MALSNESPLLPTEATASASELNVNTLKPYVDVAIVGSDTLGKPVGQLAFDLTGCEDRLRLISFRLDNALGEGGYYDGLAATMPAPTPVAARAAARLARAELLLSFY